MAGGTHCAFRAVVGAGKGDEDVGAAVEGAVESSAVGEVAFDYGDVGVVANMVGKFGGRSREEGEVVARGEGFLDEVVANCTCAEG